MRITLNNTLNFKYITIALALFFSIFSYSIVSANPEHPEEKAVETTEANHDNHQAEPATHDAHAKGGHGAEEKFNPGKMIIDHISDAHDWHIADWGGHPVSISLPVIIYSAEKGLLVFSSSKFEHGHATHEGFTLNEKNKVIAVNEDGTINEAATFYDFSITKNVVSLFVSLLLMLLIFTSVARTYKRNPGKAPKGLQAGVEMLVLFIRDDVAKASIGPKYKKYVPYLLMIFFFIWINNLMGLIPIAPFGANLSGNIAFTMTLALCTFVITLASSNKYFWQHIFAMPGVPIPVLIILIPIEVMGLFLKPIILTLRLFANMTAGHIIALAFFSLIFIFGAINEYVGLGVSVFSVAFTIFMMALELLVAFLQAYVFTLLSAIYIGGAVEEHAHHDDHAHAHPHQDQSMVV